MGETVNGFDCIIIDVHPQMGEIITDLTVLTLYLTTKYYLVLYYCTYQTRPQPESCCAKRCPQRRSR